MHRRHELLEAKMCKELDLLEEKYRTGAEMSEGDLRRIDLLAHAIKSLATYNAMKEAEETRSYGGNQSGNSYAPAYNNPYNGYPQQGAMNRFSHENAPQTSGMMPYYYQEERRW